MKATCTMGLFLLLATVTTARLAGAQEFSANEVTHDGAGHVVKNKVYRSGNKVRAEPQETGAATEQAYVIVDLTQRTSTVIMVGEKAYTQKPASPKDLVALASGAFVCPPAGATCKDDGSETLNGRPAQKWEIAQSVQGQPLLTRVWIDTQLHVWTKVEVMAGATLLSSIELQDIHEGPQAASLFAIPAGFREMTVPKRGG